MGMIITHVAMPSMVLVSLQQSNSSTKYYSFGMAFLGTIVTIFTGLIVCWVVCLVKRTPKPEKGIWLACAAFSNSVFMGKPIMTALYGDAANFPCAVLIVAFNLVCFSLGIYLVSSGKEGTKVGFLSLLGTTLRNTTIIAAFISMIFFVFSIQLPGPVTHALNMLTNLATPLALLVIGFSLSKINIREWFNDYRVYFLVSIKLVIGPLLTWFILRNLIQEKAVLGVIIIAACMPVASTIAVFSEQYDNHPVLASKTTFVSTLFCAVTAPVMISLLLK